MAHFGETGKSFIYNDGPMEVAANPMPMTECTGHREPEVSEAMMDLHSIGSWIKGFVEGLEKRLTPILSKPNPEICRQEESKFQCDLAKAIEAETRRLKDVGVVLEQLAKRLEI